MKPKLPLLLLGVSMSALAASSPAQTAPAPASTQPVLDEEVVTLSPFQVDARGDVGYLAQNTLSGSRMNTALKDTPAPISVFTREFIDDVGVDFVEDIMEYSVNMTPELSDTDDSFSANQLTAFDARYRIRGLDASQARNYFEYRLDQDVFNLERIDESRGPNAILFGVGRPGGVINSSTKRAAFGRNFTTVEFTVGDADRFRASGDHNHVLIPKKLALRLNAVYNENGDASRPHVYRRDKRFHGAVTYRITKTTTFNIEHERGDIVDSPAVPFGPSDRASLWIRSGRPNVGPGIGAAQGVNGRLNTPRVTYIEDDGVAVNLQGQSLTNSGAGLNNNHFFYNNRVIQDPANNGVVSVPLLATTSGPWHMRGTRDIRLTSASLEQLIGENTSIELAWANYDYDRFSYRQGGATHLQGDPNPTLPNGDPNPNSGRLYFESDLDRDFRYFRDDFYRVTASHQFDLGKWFGRHRFAALAERTESVFRRNSQTNVWTGGSQFGGPFHRVPDNNRNHVFYRNYIDDLNRIEDWRVGHEPNFTGEGLTFTQPDGTVLTSGWVQDRAKDDETTVNARMIAGQSFFFKNKLITTFGLREDEFSFVSPPHFRNPITNQRSELDRDNPLTFDTTARTSTFGVVYHLTPWVAVSANQANNAGTSDFFDKEIFGDPGDNGKIAPVPKGESKDVALTFDLLEGRLFVKAAYYRTSAIGNSAFISFNDFSVFGGVNTVYDNLVTGNPAGGIEPFIDQATYDAQRVVAEVGTSSAESEGYELSVTANPTPNWRFTANFSYIDSKLIDVFSEFTPWWEGPTGKPFFQSFPGAFALPNDGPFEPGVTLGQAIDLIEAEAKSVQARAGGTTPGQRHYKANLFTKYTFSEGLLKDFSVGGGARYTSGATWIQASELGAQEFEGITLFDLVLGYRKKFEKFTLNLQFNVKNVLDEEDVSVARLADVLSPYGGGYSQGYDVYKYIITPGRNIRFKVAFHF